MNFFDTARVDIYQGTTDTTPLEVLSLSQVLDGVQADICRPAIEHLRQLLRNGKQDAYARGKAQLKAATLCGTFSPTRAKKHLVQHSGIVHGDIDHLTDLQAVKQALCADPHTAYCFISPSGEGLKVGVRVAPVGDDAAYKHAWQAVADYHQQRYGMVWDRSGKDICRLCYLSYDPALDRNPDAELFAVPAYSPPQPKPRPLMTTAGVPADLRERYAQRATQTAVDIIDASTPGNRHEARLKAGTLLGGYVAGDILSYAEAYSALEAAVARNTADCPRSMKTIADALDHGQEQPITLDELEAERQEWVAQHRPRTQHTPPTREPSAPNGTRPAGTTTADDQRPVIQITHEMTRVVDAMQQAILALPEAPQLFQRAHQLCLIARGITPPKWLQRPLEAPVIVPADPAYLRELGTQAAQWHKLDKRARRWEPVLPPAWVIETLLARPSWPFPVLEGVICALTLRPDGSTLASPGYDPDTGLFLDLNGTEYPPVRERPTLDDARTAIGLLQQVFIDFPFAASHHFSTALAAVLSLVCRFTIQGNVPLFAVRSTTRGAGKGLLIDAASVIATGRQAPRWAQTQEEEEERKRLLTLALAGDTVVHIDNVRHTLGSSPLDLALTAPTVSDRILGKHASREAPLHAVFFASGNNMAFRGDTARRVVPIDLAPTMERPEERDNFAHSPLLPWVHGERPKLVSAALTILKAFFASGCPAQGITPLGSFEQWSTLVRQALIWAGEADPCEGRKDLEAESDPAYEELATLLECWQECYPTQENGTWPAVTLKRVVQDIDLYTQDRATQAGQWHDLRDALGAYDRRYEGKRLDMRAISYKLRGIEGRVIQGKRLVKAGKDRLKTVQWRVETVQW